MTAHRLRALTQHSITRHFSVLAFGTLLALLLNFLAQAYLSRHVSVATFGQINYARVLINYLLLALNFGFETYFLRALVHGQLSPGRAATMQLVVRFPLSVLATLALVWWAAQGGWSSERLLITLFGLTTLTYAFNLDWWQQVREQFSTLAALSFGRSLLVLILTVMFVQGEQDAWRYVLAVALSETLRVIVQWALLRPQLERTSVKAVSATLRTSVTISAAFFMTSVYYNIDSVMLGYFKGDETVGIYSAAYIFLTLAILPTNLLYQVFAPTLARHGWDSGVLRRYVLMTVLLSILVFAALASLHKVAILVTYGPKFAASAPVLLLLSLNVLTSYLAGAFANPVNAWGHYGVYLRIVAGGALANIVLNLLMIPRYGITGAVLTTIASEVIVAILAIAFVTREFRRRRLAASS